jgi:hypothetical protein
LPIDKPQIKNCSRESTTFVGLHVHKYSINVALANANDGFHIWRMAPVVKALVYEVCFFD